MLIYQFIEPMFDSFGVLNCLDSKGYPSSEKALKNQLKRCRNVTIPMSGVKEIIEGMFSWVPIELAEAFWQMLDKHCDLCIRQTYTFHGLARLDYHFIYRGDDASYLQFIKDNWHKAWGELFPDMNAEYKEEDLEKAKAYVEANWVNEEMSTPKIEITLTESLNRMATKLFGIEENQESIKKRRAIQNYVAENYTAYPLTDLSRSRFAATASGIGGRMEYILFTENLSQEDEGEQLWTDIYLEFHEAVGHPVMATAHTKKNALKIVKAPPITHEQAYAGSSSGEEFKTAF